MAIKKSELYSSLWKSCDQLRGGMDASPDDVKLHSSMTLFAQVDGPSSVFARVLEKYFGGKQDSETLRRPG